MKKEDIVNIIRKIDIFLQCILEFLIRDIGFLILPFIIVLLTKFFLLGDSIVSILSSSEFVFVIVMISATYIIDYTGYNVNVLKRTSNVFFFGLNISVFLLIFNVVFLVVVILVDNQFISFTNIDKEFILLISLCLFSVTIILKFNIFYQYLSKSIYQAQKFFKSKCPHNFIEDISSQLKFTNSRILSVKYDVLNVPTKKVSAYSKRFISTKLYIENQVEDSIIEINKIIHELETIKEKLTERKEEIINNCT